jgi:transcriptional regulator with XRE-family HTH domain
VQKSSHYRDEHVIKELGKKVRAIRLTKNMTLEEFANTFDLHVNQVGRIERGETNLTISYVFLIAKKLGVDVKDLLDFDL